MKAAVFHRPKHITLDEVPDPTIEEPTDVILKVTSTAICGSDLHIYNGYIPQLKPMIMGHEFMGIIVETGAAVRRLGRGDRVVVPFPIACGRCFFCGVDLPTHCENSNPNYGPEGGQLTQKGGALFGYTDLYGSYSGGQAQYVRVPYADVGARLVDPSLTDEQVLFLTDIFPTGWAATEFAEMNGGETIAVFGCGPVGVMAMKAAWLRGAHRVIGIDHLPYRLESARRCGKAEVLNFKEFDVVEVLREMTHGRGVDIAIDAVGMEAAHTATQSVTQVLHGESGTLNALRRCVSAVRRGGTVSVVGVYGTTYDNFPWGQILDKGLRIRGGQAPVHKYIDKLMALVRDGAVELDDVISHRLPLEQIANAYRIFNEKEDNCMKVVLKPHG